MALGPTAPAGVFWLEDAGDDLTPRPALDGPTEVDVAILGAGFTGLWTAWYLLARDPTLRIAVVEAAVAGFGASGRNGAWCSAAIGVTPGELARRTSTDAARRTVVALRDTVAEVGRAAAEAGLDVAYRRVGVLRVARGAHEVPSLHAALGALQQLDLADDLQLLDADAVAGRVRAAGARGGLFDPHGAVLHPGRLVRGLARAVEARGAAIYEDTRVTAVGPGPALVTDRGTVRARTVVLAGEAWLSQLPGMRRTVLPLYSLIVLTEPIDADRWAAIGWDGAELLSSRRLTVDYLSRTPEGRILFGGRGAPYHYGSRIAPAYDRHAATHAGLRAQLVDWFPALRGVGFSHAWGGPLGMPRDWMPSVRYDPASGIAGAWGYTGQGVAASNLAGRILADLITVTPSPYADLPLVGHRSPPWEPEPLRWLATRYLQWALARIDTRAQRSGRPPTGHSLAERLIRH